jgi:hypothetical protein
LGADPGTPQPELSAEADALLTLNRLCRKHRALPSQVLAEDGGLLLQLLQVDNILDRAAEERAAFERAHHQGG